MQLEMSIKIPARADKGRPKRTSSTKNRVNYNCTYCHGHALQEQVLLPAAQLDSWPCDYNSRGAHTTQTFSYNLLAGDIRMKKHLESSTRFLNSYETYKAICVLAIQLAVSKRVSCLRKVASQS
jgi:hypothetical protein